MEFRILGPLAVHSDLGTVQVPGRKRRAVLAVLLLHANEPVSPERLAVALWGEDAPASAVKNVHVLMSRLRKALGDDDLVETTPAGYRLHVQPGELDAERFEHLVADGRRALAGGQAEEAGIVLREALNLWRGPPLADLEFEPFARVEIARLEEQRQAAIEVRVEADLAAGRHAELVAELQTMVAEHPARERLAGHLMLALYRCGRQTEALDAYREARRRLATEVGIEPGEELRALHDAILHHDPSLDLEPAELPHELEAAASAPLAGRKTELAWLREQWEEARAGRGQLIAVVGPDGMGKTRLAAALAAEVYANGGTVLYASGAGPARAVHEVVDRSHRARRPLLLVVDDADHAGEDVLAAVRDVATGSALVLATATGHELDGLEPGLVLFLDLERLDSAAVAEIAALYTPDQAPDVVPAEWLLGASAGVPARVHEVASNWARQRVGAVAERAAAGRSRLRSMEDELAGGVVQLQTVREWREATSDGDDRIVCPFKGLASFEAADAPYFFGRERLVAELVARLVGAPRRGVVGPSGSGKSSVVRAGLLPALAGGVLPGSQSWPQRVIRPGEHPLQQLRDAIDDVGAGRFVLAVDQFEETFTACRDETERATFISELVRETRDGAGGAVVVAVRADFYGRCAAYPALSRLLASNHVLVGPMQREEIQRAVACPAHRVGLTVEDALVDAIVEDVEDAPGALPLLSTALLELWQHRDGRRLRLASYERTGGVRGAVARLAEEAFSHFDEREHALARRLLLQLVEVDDEGSVERRRLPLTELGGGDAEHVLDVLADRRLVTVTGGTAELAHEALLREWPRLHDWIDDDREGLRIERSLRAGAREWLRVEKDAGALLRGARLAEAQEWAQRDSVRLPEAENTFLRASVERARRDRRARRRAVMVAFAALAVGLVAIAVVAVIALDQRSAAERQRDLATSRQLALEASDAFETDLELSMRLALMAYDTAPTEQAAMALRQATAAFAQVAGLPADPVDAWTAAYSPDGTRMLSGGGEGRAIVWDPATQKRLSEWAAGHGPLNRARYSPDGGAIALGFDDGTIAVTDASLGDRRIVHEAGSKVRSLAFSGDSERLVVGVEDGTVRVVTIDGSEPPRTLGEHDEKVTGVDFAADGTRVVSASSDGTVILWRLAEADGQVVLHRGQPLWDAAFSPDGRLILAVGDDGWIRRFDGQTGQAVGRTPGEGSRLYTVAFSGDGRYFAAGGEDGIPRVWMTSGGPSVATLRGQRARVEDIGFGARADRVVSAGQDGAVRIWDATPTLTFEVPGGAWLIDFNRDGRLLATSGMDGAVRIWDAATGQPAGRLPGPSGYVVGEFSPASDAVVLSGTTSTVRTAPGPEGPATTVARVPSKVVIAANFDAREERIVYVDDAGKIVVRTLESGDEVTLRGGPGQVYDAQFSPDGERVAIHPEDGVLRIWRVDRPDGPERVLKGHRGNINGLDYGGDGRLVTAGADATARVWPAGSGSAVVLSGHAEEVTGVAFSADGSMVVTTSFDGSLRLWDSRSGDLLAPLASSERELLHVATSPDRKIAYLDDRNIVRILECEVCASMDDVEALARSRGPRQLTVEERERFAVAAD
jgi:WD40 repeat protein/DNA-binding SARP family transcriptional activator